eukprot:15399692-Heterocapsa_arctica.AAC.1
MGYSGCTLAGVKWLRGWSCGGKREVATKMEFAAKAGAAWTPPSGSALATAGAGRAACNLRLRAS